MDTAIASPHTAGFRAATFVMRHFAPQDDARRSTSPNGNTLLNSFDTLSGKDREAEIHSRQASACCLRSWADSANM